MEVFVSNITDKFSIKQISEILKKSYPLIHRSIKSLIKNGFIIKDSRELLSLNYRENLSELSYVESIRKQAFLSKNKAVFLFYKDVTEKLQSDFFIFLVFGSSVKKKSFRDIDILVIIEEDSKINETEKFLNNLASNFTDKFDINVISIKSVYEMISKRDKVNVLNETLNNHILLFGAENYYHILKNDR